MYLKIRCDEKSWKILGFGVEVNKAYIMVLFRYKKFLNFDTVALSLNLEKFLIF